MLFTPNIHDDLFKKYQPDLLVVTSLGTFDYDQLFMRQARAMERPAHTAPTLPLTLLSKPCPAL